MKQALDDSCMKEIRKRVGLSDFVATQTDNQMMWVVKAAERLASA
jgi:hypothetical protein